MSNIALIMVEEYQGPWEVGQPFQPYSRMLDHNRSNSLKWTHILGYHLVPIPSCTCLYFWKTEASDWMKFVLTQDGICSFLQSSAFVQTGSNMKQPCFYIDGFDLIFIYEGLPSPIFNPPSHFLWNMASSVKHNRLWSHTAGI